MIVVAHWANSWPCSRIVAAGGSFRDLTMTVAPTMTVGP